VVKYISFEGKAASIPSVQIDNLKIIVDSNEKVETTWESSEQAEIAPTGTPDPDFSSYHRGFLIICGRRNSW